MRQRKRVRRKGARPSRPTVVIIAHMGTAGAMMPSTRAQMRMERMSAPCVPRGMTEEALRAAMRALPATTVLVAEYVPVECPAARAGTVASRALEVRHGIAERIRLHATAPHKTMRRCRLGRRRGERT